MSTISLPKLSFTNEKENHKSTNLFYSESLRTPNPQRYLPWTNKYRDVDKFLARPGRKQTNASVRMAWISFGALPCTKRNLLTARISILLISCASLTCFRASFLPGRAKDLSAARYIPSTLTHFSAWDLRSYWMSDSCGWQLIIDVSENISVPFSTVNQLKCLPTPCNIPEERKPQLRCCESNQSRISSCHTLKDKLSLVKNSIDRPSIRRGYKEKQQINQFLRNY